MILNAISSFPEQPTIDAWKKDSIKSMNNNNPEPYYKINTKSIAGMGNFKRQKRPGAKTFSLWLIPIFRDLLQIINITFNILIHPHPIPGF